MYIYRINNGDIDCCSKERDDNTTEIKPHEEKPVTAYKYSYAYTTTPYVVQPQQQPLYHESMSQAPIYLGVSRTPTVINQ